MKITSQDLPKGYEPAKVEGRWYSHWMQNGYFKGDENSTEPKFSMVIPPPNVTGVLHMGHALNCTLQDTMTRYKRMQGFNTLWIPGMDHAGIATQNVVEKLISKEEKIKKEALGREKFVERVWQWKEKSGGMILDQQRRLGISVDWDRQRFTLDEGLSKAVRKVFVTLFKEGLIYRGNRLVNWCPRCQTAVSDLEVKHADSKGHLWHIKYPLSDGSSSLTIATTRPETMLGDTAVAVHPDDDRYKDIVGKKIKLPLSGREISIIKDEMVDQEFGSGAVKITPAHDFNDYEVGQRHSLEFLTVFDEKGRLNDNTGSYQGLTTAEARKKIVEDLENQGLLEKTEPHALSVGRCDRCTTTIEPMLSDQWFVKIQPLADPATKAVEDGTIKFHPESWTKTYLDWMYNIRDWCISRQLWWGHQIPAWHCGDCKNIVVSEDDPTECDKCQSKNLVQETDVLDTWFSSALWPFSTMGWPEKTKTLETFYPTSTLVTGFDIIFFWVCRMVMMGMHFMKEVPFKDVYIHSLIRDESGQKMSKSKGNVVDPLDLVKDYGTDALRFTLASLVAGGRDIRFSLDRLDGYRNFINKIWNATRFCLGALENIELADQIDSKKLTIPDKYILESLKKTTEVVTEALDQYRFTDAANALYKFTWHEFCDWYLELSKPVLYGEDVEQKSQSGAVLVNTLERLVRLLHPLTPFITEEIYHLLPNHKESITVQPFPKTDDPLFALGDSKAHDEIELLKGVMTAIRNIRGENRINPGVLIGVRVCSENQETLKTLEKSQSYFKSIAKADPVNFETQTGDMQKSAVNVVAIGEQRIVVVVPLEGLVDFQEEIKRLKKEIEKVQKDLNITEGKLKNEKFIKNAPAELVAVEKGRQSQLADKKAQLVASLDRMG